MSKSARLRAADLRAISLLVGECCDLRDDSIAWRQHMLTRVARLAGAGFCVLGDVGDAKLPSRYDLGTVDLGADNGFDRAGWLRSLKEFRTDSFFNPHMNAMFDRVPPGVVLPRADLVPDREWYTSFCYQTCLRTLGADASIFCMRPIPGSPDDYSVLYLLRPIGEQDFTGRQRAFAAEAMARVAPLLGGPLARLHEPAPSALPRRIRLVLRYLLEGDSDQHIAERMKLSRFTVNEYVDRIYRHFGVQSRTELLARWIRRRWRDPLDSEQMDLPPRPRQVLRCLLEGDSNKQVASRLGLSQETVKEYVNRIFRCFGVQSRQELLARWIHHSESGL
jgi:DNA-binding NarL/FixJ family response regulator